MKHVKLQILLLLLYPIFFIGCFNGSNENVIDNKGHNKPYKEKFTLVSCGDKKFKLDSLTSSDRLRFQYFYDTIDKKDFLYVLDIVGQSIQKFDWQTMNLVKKVKLSKEGPSGVGTAEQFFVASPDSIFVLSYFSFRLSLLNSEAQVRDYYQLINGETMNGKMKLGAGTHPLTKEHSPMMLIGNYVLLGGYPYADRWKPSFYSNGEVGLKVNLKTKEIRSLMKLPNHFLTRYENNGSILCGQQVTGIGQSYNIAQKKVIFNIPTEPLLYSIDIDNTQNVKTYYAGSKFFNQILLARKNLKDIKKEFDYYTHTPSYQAIHYENVNQFYWRFVAVPNSQKKNEFDGKPWFNLSVILLNNDLEKVGEATLDNKFFMTPSILFAGQNTYIKQYTAKESEVVFTRFEVRSNVVN